MGFIFLFSIALSWFVFFVYNVKMFVGSTRLSSLKEAVYPALISSFPQVFISLLFIAGGRYLFLIITANVPLFTVPMMFYSYVLFNALLFWVPIMGYGLYRDFKGMVSHMLPYGAPTGLMLFLPLVEIFSQVIRPLTLTIRFATNLSAGHIMIFMFSYFSILSSVLAPFLYVVLTVLLLIEVFIAFLQAYIFITLLGLYLDETI
jgi:F-type H+-transporting ATPase subunit a